MGLDQSKTKLKAALHGLEGAINKLAQEVRLLRQENNSLKAENLSLQQQLSAPAESKAEVAKEVAASKAGALDMLEPTAVSSIDMSINELRNMVKSK